MFVEERDEILGCIGDSYRLDGRACRRPGRSEKGNCAKHQRELTAAIKRARAIALLPFTTINV